MRYAIAALLVFAVVAAGVADGTNEPRRTDVPAIDLVSERVSEPKGDRRGGPKAKKQREVEAAPERSPPAVPAGDDDDDIDDDGD
jgi:hypothetical protein